jgi:predicted component of type VI protein secretion system
VQPASPPPSSATKSHAETLQLRQSEAGESPPRAILIELRDGIPIAHVLRNGRNVLGRDTDMCNVLIPGAAVSRQHAMVFAFPDNVLFNDVSNNGSLVNDEEVRGGQSVSLNNEDVLTVGDTKLLVLLISPEALRHLS